jgi:hypothetical protein
VENQNSSDHVSRRCLVPDKETLANKLSDLWQVLFNNKGFNYMADAMATNVLISDSTAIATEPTAPPADPLIDFEAEPEFRRQFQVWKEAKIKEVLAYLHNNWNLKEVTIERLVMMPQFVFPDREKRNEYGQVAPGQSFADADGNVVPHPITGQPMVFTVWRRVDPPAAAIPEEGMENTVEDEKPEIEPAIAAV